MCCECPLRKMHPQLCIVSLFFFILGPSLCQVKLVPEVETEEGIVRGSPQKSREGRDYVAFEGIPYAEKPERFSVSEPKTKWEGVLDASKPGSVCAQQFPGDAGALVGLMGVEDCLFINVYSPHLNEDKLFPVMVWIHGGAFALGSGAEYGASYMMDEDIILVTFNYRIGVLGFLYFEDNTIPGNLGMKDQVLALKWVQRNIHHFGGDPRQVTIFGESAGAVSVHLHVLSSMSRGLFQRAIIQSGSAFAPWAVSPFPRWNAIRFAQALECPMTSPAAILKCLKEAPFDEIVKMQIDLAWGPIPSYHIAPVIEYDKRGYDEENAFLIRRPHDMIMRREIANPVPILMGLVKNEGAFIFSQGVLREPELISELNANWTGITPLMFLFHNRFQYTSNIMSAAYKIRDFYFGDYAVSPGTEQRLTDAFSDRYFVHSVHHAIRAHSDFAPVYPYLLTFNGGGSILHFLDYHNFEPPTHADELAYLFTQPSKPILNSDAEKEFSKRLVRLWASFAISGKPTALYEPAEFWPPVNGTNKRITWLQLDRRTQLLGDPFYTRVRFWDHLLTQDLRGFD